MEPHRPILALSIGTTWADRGAKQGEDLGVVLGQDNLFDRLSDDLAREVATRLEPVQAFELENVVPGLVVRYENQPSWSSNWVTPPAKIVGPTSRSPLENQTDAWVKRAEMLSAMSNEGHQKPDVADTMRILLSLMLQLEAGSWQVLTSEMMHRKTSSGELVFKEHGLGSRDAMTDGALDAAWKLLAEHMQGRREVEIFVLETRREYGVQVPDAPRFPEVMGVKKYAVVALGDLEVELGREYAVADKFGGANRTQHHKLVRLSDSTPSSYDEGRLRSRGGRTGDFSEDLKDYAAGRMYGLASVARCIRNSTTIESGTVAAGLAAAFGDSLEPRLDYTGIKSIEVARVEA